MDYDVRQAALRAKIDMVNETAIRERPRFLEGLACRYNVVHEHKGRKEMFAPGCFDGSLFGVAFFIDHALLTKKLGDQDDYNLELIDSDIGLAFRLRIDNRDIDRLAGRDSMSPSYVEHAVEMRDGVRVITKASLFEISACYTGAIQSTFAVVREKNAVGAFGHDVKSRFASDAAWSSLQRALRKMG